ncbi:MAG TPA: aspartate aminotransferase [Deltaproteobacteria bacterium]|nr:aspartate aminotransferase [Deltaproteobacteria bacterium]HCP44434.1 aspartate aminotransferase [Deltaproteobacteria bacterium]
MIHCSKRVAAIPSSATLAIKARARELSEAGHDIIDLSAGEPDGSPPPEAGAAGIEAIEGGSHRYTPVPGMPQLRSAIAAMYRERHGLDIGPERVMVTMGGKQALYNLALALFNPGDEVILFAPHWVSYMPQLQLAEAKGVVIPTRPEDGFQPDLDAARAAITDRTRAIIINSPGNPTGTIIERERLEALAQLAEERDLVVISDEIYDGITYDGASSCCFPTLREGLSERTIIINAVSKTYAMTGWRVGWMVAPPEVVGACCKIQSHSTSGVCAVNQRAAIAAIKAPRSFLDPILSALTRRRALLTEGLEQTPGIEVGPPPLGAFYLFPRVDGLFGRTTPDGTLLTSSLEVADFFINQAGVAVVPGEGFGEPRCVRISYATSYERLSKGLGRLQDAIAELN